MRQLQVSLNRTILPAAKTSSVNGSTIDLAGYDGASVVYVTGAYTDGTHTPKVQESADNSTWTDVAAGDLVGAFAAVSSTAGQNANQRVDYIGKQRYIRLVITVASATTGLIEGGFVILGHGAKLPTGAGA